MSVETLKVSWSLRGVGSAKCTWSPAEEESILIYTTYLSDGFSELIEVGIALRLGARTSFATLLGEPVGHRIFFSESGGSISVEIVRFDDPMSPEDGWNRGKVRWSGTLSKTVLIEAILDMAESVLREHDLDGYQREWGFQFPIDRYRKLKGVDR